MTGVDARAATRPYREIFGGEIRVGDRVTTAWNTGPYEIWRISGPHDPSYDPLVEAGDGETYSLVCVPTSDHPHFDRERCLQTRRFSYINSVWRAADGRLIAIVLPGSSEDAMARNEIFVERNPDPAPCQESLFGGTA